MELIKNSERFDKFIGEFKKLESDSVEIGWFSEQGRHRSGLTYPRLARIHRNGIRVPKRDVLRLATFNNNPKKSRKVKSLLKRLFKGKLDVKNFYESLGRSYRNTIMNSFGDRRLGVTNNPTPLIETGDWKRSTSFKLKSESKIRKR